MSSNQSKQQQPGPSLLRGHPWKKHTNVQETWMRFGWQPINPLPVYGTPPIIETKGKQA